MIDTKIISDLVYVREVELTDDIKKSRSDIYSRDVNFTQELLKNFNILGDEIINQQLYVDMSHTLSRLVIKKIHSQGSIENIKFVKDPSGYNSDSLRNNMNSIERLIVKNKKYFDFSYVITNGQLGSAIQDLSSFKPANINLAMSVFLFCIGTIHDIPVYVDQYMKWNDNWLIFGKQSESSIQVEHVNVLCVIKQNLISKIEHYIKLLNIAEDGTNPNYKTYKYDDSNIMFI